MAWSDMIVYDSIRKSNMPLEQKSVVRQWFDNMSNIVTSDDRPKRGIGKEHVISAVQAIRQSAESNLVAGGLGVFHAEVGLDVGKVPVDFTGGMLATGASIAFARHEISRDLLNMGNAATNCFSFRKGYAWAAARKARHGGMPAGKMGEVNIAGEENDDPIVRVARNLKT
jgi:hypothetical protein